MKFSTIMAVFTVALAVAASGCKYDKARGGAGEGAGAAEATQAQDIATDGVEVAEIADGPAAQEGRLSDIADAGKNFEMDAISACVVGGVSASGGAGSVLGMVIGATLIGVINLGMFQVNLDANYQRVVKGFVLLAAVVFDILSKKKQK